MQKGSPMTDRAFVEPIVLNSLGVTAFAFAPQTLRAGLRGRLDRVVIRDTAFLEEVLQALTEVLAPVLLFLGTLEPGGRVSTIVTEAGGQRVDNFSYLLNNTPCATVLGPQSLCIYPSDVAGLFPLDRDLQKLGAEGYVGMPLLARDGRQIGIVVAVTDHEIDNLDDVRSLLKVFGKRLSLELERSIAGETQRVTIEREIIAEEKRLADAVGHAC